MKILISDKLANEGVDILKAVDGMTVDCKTGLSPEELKAIIKEYDALIIRSGTTVTADIIEAADKLKFIGRAGVGLDNVDLKAATKKGIVAMNTPAGNTTSTAEQTMSLILSLARNIPQAYASMRAKRWDRAKFKGVELRGKILGVVGFGRIGSTVASFAKAFGMEPIVFDPFLSEEVAQQKGVRMVELETLLKESDYITLHIPKTAETKNLISDKEFELMKPDARLINCARGGIVNEAALIKALEAKRIAGCALDVYESEPPDFSSKLFELDNCITTPHLGASTSEAQINVAIEIAETIRDAMTGKGIVNAANFPSVDAQTYKVLSPYIDLGLKVGTFAGQLVKGRMQAVKIIYSGVPTEYKTASVTLSVINGLLKPLLGDSVNFINALDLAKERAINVQDVKCTKETEFLNCLQLEITTDQETFVLVGTLSSNQQPRIVKVNNIYVEAVPDGNMLVINNNDKPGMVGAVGSILAQANINIASITFGREAAGGIALSVVNTDTEIPEATLIKLKEVDDILFVKQLKV